MIFLRPDWKQFPDERYPPRPPIPIPPIPHPPHPPSPPSPHTLPTWIFATKNCHFTVVTYHAHRHYIPTVATKEYEPLRVYRREGIPTVVIDWANFCPRKPGLYSGAVSRDWWLERGGKYLGLFEMFQITYSCWESRLGSAFRASMTPDLTKHNKQGWNSVLLVCNTNDSL